MGFISKKNYEIKDLGVVLPTAYAMIDHISIDKNGKAHATFSIQQSREDVINKNPLERINVTVDIDKTQPIYSQVYIAAKESKFADWEDNIVEDEATENTAE